MTFTKGIGFFILRQSRVHWLRMTKLTFFHHKRKDGAVRSGVELDDELLLQKYIPGAEERDSALLWYVDVRCTVEGSAVTANAGSARMFFERIGEPVEQALQDCAEELAVGLDSEVWPLRKAIKNLPAGIRGEVVCSAMRRVADGELSQLLRELASNWIANLNELREEPAAIA